MKFRGYHLKSKIAESENFSVFKGLSENDGGPIIIKTVREDRMSLSQKNKLNHEFSIGKQLSGKHTLSYLYNGTEENHPFIVVEDFGALSLAEYIQDKPLSIEEFFTFTKAITRALLEIHQAKIIHKDINPQNILYNPENQLLKIGDFGISSTLKKEVQKEVAVNSLEGTLEYLSPEQTGRMNREIDFRSDFYSLGITFYELASDRRPFSGKDKLDLIHAHLALNPIPLHKINPKIPEYIGRIVEKLMAKNAENRYQSARGLYHDLEKAEAYYKDENTAVFELGEKDSSAYFSIPGKLYGRQQEIKSLLKAFDNVCEGGREIVMVSGYSGIGKSAMVNEITKSVTKKKAYFIKGKYDQYQTNKPYYGMIQAYRSLIQQFLVESDEIIANWKDIFLEAFGPNGQLMIDVIPELELIIGKQPPVTDLKGDAAKTRFTILFGNFIRALTSTGKPLVVFLDDLQWADIETINIIHDLLKIARHDEAKKLFLIGAYRDNEVTEAHPLMIMLEQVKELGVQISDLKLLPIQLEDVCNIVIDTFNCNKEEGTELAHVVFKKTGGNPFFVIQFLSSLYMEELVVFDNHSGNWIWDVKKIKSRGFTDNIIDLMIKNVEKLDKEAINVLKIASALGAQFKLETLLLIIDKNKDHLVESLRKSVDAGLITQDSYSNEEVKSYEFLHDRIQQASYSFLAEEELLKLHHRIGKILLSELKEGEQQELFDIVNHLNKAKILFERKADRLELAELNYQASQKAKNSNAYFSAMEYLENAIELLPAEPWSENYQLTLDIYSSAVEVSFLNKDYKKMDELTQTIEECAKELIDKIPSYEIKVQCLAAQSKLLEAIEEARKILSLIGVNLPKNPGQMQIMSGLISTKLLTGRKKPMALLHHKEMRDPLALAAMRILISTSSSAFLAMPNMFPLIVFNLVKLSHKKGISKYSSYGYTCYGFIHCGVLGNIKLGTEFGQLALDLDKHFDALELKAKNTFLYYGFIHHWKYPIRETKHLFLEGYKRGLEVGDLEYGGWNMFHYCSYALFSGYSLEETESHFRKMKIQADNLGLQQISALIELWTPMVGTLIGTASGNEDLIKLEQKNDPLLNKFLEINFTTAVYERFLSRGMCYYFFGFYEKAHEQLEQARPLIDSVVGMEYSSQYYFFAALTYARLDPKKYPGSKGKLNKMISKLKKIAKFAKENYQHKYQLALAEKCRIDGQFLEALDLYDQAAKEAEEHLFLNDRAIALECAALMFLDMGKKDLAYTYWLNAKNAYQKWGANAKVEMMTKQEKTYSFSELKLSFAGRTSKTNQSISQHHSSTSDSGINIDVDTIIKASQSITGEIVLDNLLNKLLKLLVQNAGAESGYLLLQSPKGFEIGAKYSTDKELEDADSSVKSISPTDQLAWSIVEYVAKTKETAIIDSATEDSLFNKDPFILSVQPLSVLCAPFINQGKLQGIVYLSNNLMPGAFTEKRLALLKLLAGQIAISIENALFYDDLEKRVQTRTHELQIEKKKSDDLLLNILPEQVAEELKQTGKSKARKYENVSVIFTDFKEFTKKSEKLSPEDLVEEIDGCFKVFDDIISKHHLEKIKTIGDAYMCVDGIPDNAKCNPVNAVKAAIEIRDFIQSEKVKRQKEGRDFFEIRIGIHTGPVVAGIVGRKKFAFDIWGDTVNTAARMEQSGQTGKVNISEATYQLVEDHFTCEYRGKIEAKNKGAIDMYFIEQ